MNVRKRIVVAAMVGASFTGVVLAGLATPAQAEPVRVASVSWDDCEDYGGTVYRGLDDRLYCLGGMYDGEEVV